MAQMVSALESDEVPQRSVVLALLEASLCTSS